jgi:transcriptional regulator with XRE-family HTH domain
MLGDMNAQQTLRLFAARRYAETGKGRAIRRRHGLSMAEVAQAIDVPESTICRWELGRRLRLRGEGAIRWAELLGQLERAA